MEWRRFTVHRWWQNLVGFIERVNADIQLVELEAEKRERENVNE